MLKLGFSEVDETLKLVKCVLRPPYSNAMSRRDNTLNTFLKKSLSLVVKGLRILFTPVMHDFLLRIFLYQKIFICEKYVTSFIPMIINSL